MPIDDWAAENVSGGMLLAGGTAADSLSTVFDMNVRFEIGL